MGEPLKPGAGYVAPPDDMQGWADPVLETREFEEAGAPQWLVTYGDLVSQILIFFVLFFSVTKENIVSEFEAALAEYQGDEEVVQREIQPGEVVIRISGKVLFDSGDAVLKPEAHPALDRAFTIIRENFLAYGPATVRVEGHTDDRPISTLRFPSNWELSAARAVSVVRYFLDQGYLRSEDLQLMGYGEFRPIASNETAEGRQKNRRVEIKIVRSNTAAPALTPGGTTESPQVQVIDGGGDG